MEKLTNKHSIAYLPFPPSTNTLFGNSGKGRRMTKKYAAWRKEAGQELNAQRVKPVPGRVYVKISLVAPDKRRRDGDNTQKAIFDLLVKHTIIDGDDNRTLIGSSWEWCQSGHPCTVQITSRGENNALE